MNKTITWLDPHFWSHHFRSVYCTQLPDFHNVFTGRVLKTFASIEAEAEAAAEQEWQRLMHRPADEDEDIGALAEQAEQLGVSTYLTLDAMRQSMVNLAAAALYHIFEQQILFFHRKQVLHRSEENNMKLITMKEFKVRLSSAGIDYEALPSWKKMNELRLVANVVKHAEGQSAMELRNLRPVLFEPPSLREKGYWERFGTLPVDIPLAGEGIYLTTDDLDTYHLSLCNFWGEFADAIMGTV